MKRDLMIAALVTVAVLIGLAIHTSYTTITSADDATREGIEEIDAALERTREATRQREEAERQRQERIDTHL